MPELPEVETVKRGIAKFTIGKKILDVEVLNPKSFQASNNNIEAFLKGAKIINARRRAKVLIIDLSTEYSLVIHLKMTGQLVFRGNESWAAGHPTESFENDLPDRSTRVVFELSDGAKLFFNDQRKFGWIKLLPTNQVMELEFLKKVGPEPLEGNPHDEFLKRIRRHNGMVIKAAILNQSTIAGIGNIYADEALWGAKVNPSTRVRDLTDKKLLEILDSVIEVMNRSIKSGGSTMKNYIKADGSKGDYLEKFANVFRREGKACSRCGEEIIKTRVAGRGTHVCLGCQNSPHIDKNG